MEYTRESSRDFFRQIIPQRLSQLSGSTKKLSPLCRRRSANFLLFRPWAIKAQSYEHKTRPRSSDTFMTPTFPFTVQRECKAIHLHCLISKEKKVKKHKKYLTCKKIVSFSDFPLLEVNFERSQKSIERSQRHSRHGFGKFRTHTFHSPIQI